MFVHFAIHPREGQIQIKVLTTLPFKRFNLNLCNIPRQIDQLETLLYKILPTNTVILSFWMFEIPLKHNCYLNIILDQKYYFSPNAHFRFSNFVLGNQNLKERRMTMQSEPWFESGPCFMSIFQFGSSNIKSTNTKYIYYSSAIILFIVTARQ